MPRLLVTLLTLIAPSMLSADIIVKFGGEYVSSSQPLAGNAFISNGIDIDGDSSPDDEIGGRAFSSSLPFSPSSNYSGTSSRFYGGAILGRKDYSAGDTAFDEAEIVNQGKSDSVHLHASHTSHLHDLRIVYFWEQADFLSGSGPVTFNADSLASITIGSSSTEGMSGAQIRLIVRDDSNNYWLSETALDSPNANEDFTWDSSNQGFSATSDGNWASYNPNTAFSGSVAGTDLRFDQSGPYSDKKFSGVTGVGFFFEQDTFHNNLDFHFHTFEVNAVPEPGALGVVAMVGLVSAARFRRRRAI
jgi:hypothetical protein